jgi:aminoglycoside phosphotransferase family enzyme
VAPVTLAARLAFLRRPGSYPHRPRRVRVVETHMSWLFLAGGLVYKLKKPLARNGMDHRSREKRRRACLRELRLNRRLAADTYLRVEPLVLGDRGLALGGDGRVVDWLVCMRRLPESRTLERRMRRGRVDRRDVDAIAARLARFFRAARNANLSGAAYARKLHGMVDEACARMLRPRYRLDATRIRGLAGRLHRCVDDARVLPAAARARRVVEGHGDLRPEHVYLTTPPTIIDGIEFDRRLRLRDPLEEVAFLALECERAGHPRVGASLFAAYARHLRDRPPRALFDFYQAFDAFLRARIAAWHLDDPRLGPASRWRRRTDDYLGRAEAHLARAETARRRTAAA